MTDGALDPTHAKNLGLLADLFRALRGQAAPTPAGPVGLAGGRLSNNVMDIREGGGWNWQAKKALADQYGSINAVEPVPQQVDIGGIRPAKMAPTLNPAGVGGKTPANGGVADYLNTRQFSEDKMDEDGNGPKSGPEIGSTYTPDNTDYYDGSKFVTRAPSATPRNPPAVDGMSTRMMPQTRTPPSIPPAPAEALGTMNAPIPTLPAPGASASPPSPDIMGALRSLFGIA